MRRMKQEKVWCVTVGYNWSSVSVIARDYVEAARKAIRIIKPPKSQKFVFSIKQTEIVYR